jgi:hypothetical protein
MKYGTSNSRSVDGVTGVDENGDTLEVFESPVLTLLLSVKGLALLCGQSSCGERLTP